MYRKRQKLIVTLFTLVLICLFGLTRPAYAQEQQDKVLILNSYHSNLNWTNNIVMSVLDEFKKSQLDLMVYTEYMDWKNHPQDQHIDNLYRTYKEKYQQNKIDMIITTDDKALEFALKYREEIFSNAPIVFAGTNEEGEQELIRDHKNLTGVIEHIDLEETVDMALRINPEMKKFYIIYDQTESGKSTYSIVNNIIKSKYKSIKPISITNKSHAHVLAAVNELEEDSAILITNYYSDINGKVIADEEFCKIISDTVKVPVFHMYGLTMGHGNIGGSMICAHRQGESAGQLATKILKGKKADELPIIRNTPMKLAFDYEQLQRFDIPMKLVPKEAEIINQPFSFFRAYKELVISWLVILCLLVMFIIGLIIYITKVRKIQKALSASNALITENYEELAASDEELQDQFKEVKRVQNQLREMAYYDALTEMPNKRSLEEDLKTYIDDCKGKKGAVIFIDVDDFKLINDTLGHSIGDKFIIQIGKRLQKLTGQSMKAYRMGGDEFLLLITNVSDRNDIKKIVDQVMGSFKEGFLIDDMMIHTTVSAGITIYPDHGHTSETLIMGADIAMYKAKAIGKNNYVFYNKQMNEEILERTSIETNLRKGLVNNEFSLNYQPQYDLENKKIVGFEALIRWNSKKLGPMPPFKFIQIAEDSHLIIPIGKWVLQRACEFISKIHKLGYKDHTIAVNISTLQVMQENFVEMVVQTLEDNDLEPKHLEIEMTETMLIENFQMVVEKLQELRGHGIRIALDDFGIGYSSLNYLNRLPIDTLKIDKSFIDTIVKSGEEKTIINILIILGQRMGLNVIAEGVETKIQFDYLNKQGCNHMQGYLLSKPLAEEDIYKLLDEKD